MSAIQILTNTDPMKIMFDLGEFSLGERAVLLKIYDMATGEQPDLGLWVKVQKLDGLFLELWKAECTRQYLFSRFGKKYAGDFEVIVDG